MANNAKVKQVWLTFISFYVNALLEKRPQDLTFPEVYDAIEDRSLFEMLERRYPGEFDFSPFDKTSEQRIAILSALKDAAGGLEGRERRKVGVERSGLHLLLALLIEAIQQSRHA